MEDGRTEREEEEGREERDGNEDRKAGWRERERRKRAGAKIRTATEVNVHHARTHSLTSGASWERTYFVSVEL